MSILPIEFDHRSDLSGREGFLPIYDEFKRYKSLSKTHSRPTKKYQEKYASISPLLGRDRFNADDNIALELAIESLTHIHVKQKSCIWIDEEEDLLVQWDCTSNAYLIYSYFVHNSVRYYFVVTFIDNNAHANWDNEDAKRLWLEDAKKYRLSITSCP